MIYARQFAKNRAPVDGKMNRLYSIESQYSITGSSADFRFAMKSSQIGIVLDRLEKMIDGGKGFEGSKDEKPYNELSPSEKLDRALEAIASDLLANKGASLLTVGSHQEIAVQETALRINAKLGNLGKTFMLLDIPNPLAALDKLRLDDFVTSAKNGEIKTAWILTPNPAFSVAGDIDVAGALSKIDHVIYAADADDETSLLAEWILPAAHPLEAWGDVYAADGTYGVGQPQIEALRGAKSPLEIGLILSGSSDVTPADYVKQTAAKIVGGSFNDRQWKEILHAGFLADSAAKQAKVTIAKDKPAPKAIPGLSQFRHPKSRSALIR